MVIWVSGSLCIGFMMRHTLQDGSHPNYVPRHRVDMLHQTTLCHMCRLMLVPLNLFLGLEHGKTLALVREKTTNTSTTTTTTTTTPPPPTATTTATTTTTTTTTTNTSIKTTSELEQNPEKNNTPSSPFIRQQILPEYFADKDPMLLCFQPTHLKHIEFNMGIFPNFRAKHKS